MGRGRRSGSSSSSGSDLAPRRTKNDKKDDDRGGGADEVRAAGGGGGGQWSSQGAGDRKGAAVDSDEEDGGRRDGYRRGSDAKSARDGREREQGTSERYRDGRHERYGREREMAQGSRVRADGSERERGKERMDYDERARHEPERVRRDRYDPDMSRSEREKRQRTDRGRPERDGDGRDHSHSRIEPSRERYRNDRDERGHRGRDYSREDEDREFSGARDRELARNVQDRDLPSRARGKANSKIEESKEVPGRGSERELSRDDRDSELDLRGGETLDANKELSRARGESAVDGERASLRRGREKERESPRRGSGSRSESGRGAGRLRIGGPKDEEIGDDDGNERERLPRRLRDSSPDVSLVETAKGRRNESPELRRVRARRDNEVERGARREEDGTGRRGKVRKDRGYSSDEEDRSTRRRVENDREASMGGSRGDAPEALAGALVVEVQEDLNLSLGLRTGKDEEATLSTVEMAMEITREVGYEAPLPLTLSKVVEKDKEKPALHINVEGKHRRIASPSPKTKPHLPSASESGGSDSSRSASPAMSLTPERATFTKPTRATPDIRRRERSPNPSPLSPRSRLPPPRSLGALSPILPTKLVEEALSGQVVVRSRVDDELDAPSVRNGDEEGSRIKQIAGNVMSDLAEDQHPLEDGETLDRWVPGDDDEELLILNRGGNGNVSFVDNVNDRHTQSDRWESRTDREKRDSRPGGRGTGRSDSKRRQDESIHNNAGDGSGKGRYGDHARYRGDETLRNSDTNRQRSLNEVERGTQRDGEREGHRWNGEPILRNRESGRESERKQVVNGDATRSRQEKLGSTKSGEKVEPAAEVKKVERERPQLPPGRSGGVYIPPFKLAQMLKEVDDKSSNEYQRLTWDALRKSINGLVNKVNASNLKNILPELFSENLIRGRGLFARSCMKSQMASPTFTHVFAALVAVVNTKFPELGELLLKRIILQLRRAFKRNDKPVLLAAAKFIAHLVNQQVAHEILALELLTVLLENPTDDSVEVAVGFVKECGATLQNLSSQGLHAIFERFRGILHEGEIDKRVQFMIEGLFAIRKANFQGYAGVLPELDLVEQEDQITHELSLEDDLDDESFLDVFKPDPNFLESEKKYEAIKRDILGDDSDEDGAEDGDKDDDEEESDEEDEEDEDEREQRMQIQDETETNLVNLRRTIYLTIMSSVDFEEAGHKLLKIKLEPGQEMELCIMLLECCSQERTYLRYYGLLGQRFCMINRVYQENFDQCFVKQYSMIHRLETNKLRNVAKFFAHLLGTDALPWQALAYIRLTEEDTTSSSRIFIKILFQELSEHLGLRKLNERLSDPMMQESFDGIFPKDNPKNIRFAINFFTSIGLGGLTDSLREYLKNMPRLIMQQHPALPSESEDSSSSSEPDGSGSSADSDSSTESDTVSDSSSESESEGKKRRKKKHK